MISCKHCFSAVDDNIQVINNYDLGDIQIDDQLIGVQFGEWCIILPTYSSSFRCIFFFRDSIPFHYNATEKNWMQPRFFLPTKQSIPFRPY